MLQMVTLHALKFQLRFENLRLRVILSQKLLNILSATSSPYGGDLFHLLYLYKRILESC